MELKLNKESERKLRQDIAAKFRRAARRFPSEQAAANDLGISRQRFQQYLDMKMTPKADVLLLAMAKWHLKISYSDITFGVSRARRKSPQPPVGQLKLDLFDAPQVLESDQGNIRMKVARKQPDTLKLSVQISLAG